MKKKEPIGRHLLTLLLSHGIPSCSPKKVWRNLREESQFLDIALATSPLAYLSDQRRCHIFIGKGGFFLLQPFVYQLSAFCRSHVSMLVHA